MATEITLENIRELFMQEMQKRASGKNDADLLTRKAAATYLKIKPNTLAVWALKGTGPSYVKIGNRCMYSRVSLEKFVQQNTVPR